MKVLCFRCANGVVMYTIKPDPKRIGRRVRCLNDGAIQHFALSKPGDIPAMLQTLAARAVQLRGAIAEVFEVTI